MTTLWGARRRLGRRRYDVAFYVPWITALLHPGAESPPGGAETQIYLLAQALAARGVRPCLIAYEMADAHLPPSIEGVGVVFRRRHNTHRRVFGRIGEVLFIWHSLIRAPADTVVTRTAGPNIGIVAAFAKLTRRRFVYSSANVVDFNVQRLESKRRNLALFNVGVRLADQVVVQTEEQVEMCRQRFSRSPVLIKSLAEPAQQRNAEPEAFLWIGRLVSYKQPLEYVELARAVPEARFWMVGVPAPSVGGERLVAEVRAAADGVPNLELLAPRARPRLMELIGRSVAVVNTADFEGMPNIFLEGWTRGVPSLGLSHDPNGVIVRHKLGGFAGGSPGRLAELAREAWAGRHDQVDVVERCRRYIELEHSPEAVAERWVRVLGFGPTASFPEARTDAEAT